mgnify:CR=1 FL=1
MGKIITAILALALPMTAQAEIYLCTETADYISDAEKTVDFYFPEIFVWVVNSERGIKQSFEQPDAYRGSCEIGTERVLCNYIDEIGGNVQNLIIRLFDLHFSWVSQSPDIVRAHMGQCTKT